MRWLSALVLVATVGLLGWAAAPPGKTRELTAEEAKVVAALEAWAERHTDAGEFEQAAKVVQEVADYRRARQGARHWRAIDARFKVEEWKRLEAVATKDRAEVIRARSVDLQGLALLNQGRAREAIKSLRLALSLREKVLGKEHPDTATSYNNVAGCLQALGKAAEALPLFRRASEVREKVLGKEHPHTAGSYNNVAGCLQALGKPAEALPLFRRALEVREKVLGKEHPHTAGSYNNVAFCLQALGKPAEALPLFRRASEVSEKVLGKEHPDTATSYNNVALCLRALGKAAEALPLFRRASEVSEKVLGKEHPHTAGSYNNVAFCLQALGKPAEALPLFRRASEVSEKVLGKEHPDTATSYNNVASCLQALGKPAEALPLFRRASEVREKVLGKEHPDTATSYNNVAFCLQALGKPAEALPLYRRALEVSEKVLGKEHPDTATSYNNVAFCLQALGKPAEALPLFRRASEVSEKVLGKEHPHTAGSYNNVASCLQALGKAAEALPLFRRALEVREKVLGKEHPDTAQSYNNVAVCLDALGKPAKALPLFRRASEVSEKVLGKEHPHTAQSYNNVAGCLWRLEDRGGATLLWQHSLRSQEAARAARVESGFDRAHQTEGYSTHEALAVGLANLKQPRNAFRHAEASLARGLLDDLSGLTAADRERLAGLRASMAKLEPVLASFSASGEGLEQTRHAAARREYGRLWREFSETLAEASERALVPLGRIQRSIPDDGALVLWASFGERWACIVRREGAPIWQKLAASTDGKLSRDLYLTLLDPTSTVTQRQKHLDAFRKERFEPLLPHLKGVKRLFVVPTKDLAYIPADLFADGFAIHYVPSGSVLARLAESHRALDPTSLLVLGDPIFDKAAPPEPPEPPAHGVLVLSVLPNGHAAKVGVQSGDVLLSVGKTKLESFDDLKGALSSLPADADVWRDGKTFAVRIQGSPLGVVLDPRSARAAVRAFRQERELLAQRATGHKRLPGTRIEAEAVAAMVKGSTTLVGSDASEQKLDALIDAGKLKGFRVLHFGTHGEVNRQIPRLSSLILAQDALPDPLAQVNAGKHPYDGRLTVSRIRERWTLDADLVVLSACETGLGKDGKGEGLLGFAQAFLSKGARSVVLSRWKVDDTATSLLMIRFYENLLGKRQGFEAMGRADALDEAKKWLRTLPRQEAERLATLHTGGVLRGSEGSEKVPDKTKKVEYKGDAPFAHPYYWAAWTLIGDPD